MKYLLDVNALVALGFSGQSWRPLTKRVQESYRIP